MDRHRHSGARYRRGPAAVRQEQETPVNAKFGASVAVVGLFLYVGYHHKVPDPLPAVATAAHVRGGTLNCADLERLWESAGGSPGTAFTAAEIAMAESGGDQYATDTNGGRSTDRGYWQINSVHGSLSAYDAYANARAAVQISGDGSDWTPWVTYDTGVYAGRC
jgi:Lysozyme like domain